MELKFQSKLELCPGNHVAYRRTDRQTERQIDGLCIRRSNQPRRLLTGYAAAPDLSWPRAESDVPKFSGAAPGTFRESWRIWCSYWYILPSKCAWKACFSILLAQGEIPSGSMHPSHWLPDPTREKTKSNRGVGPGSPFAPSEGAFELTHGSACIIGW